MIGIMTIFSSNVFALGAADWVYLKDYSVELPIFVKGTYMQGSNITEPRPAKSTKSSGDTILNSTEGW